MDQAGEKTSPKNCYGNPFNPFVCIFTALGCFVALNEETWVSTKNTIFRAKDSKPGTASHIYCNRIRDMFSQYEEKIAEYVRVGHACSHGTRKGSAIEVSSGTTLPASMAAIANRGEWSLSTVMDIYLGFAEPGDHYLGRLLSGLDPNSSTFAAIPPHFVEGMDNEYINEAMHFCFSSILGRQDAKALHGNAKGILLRCLASMVHHSEKILNICKNVANNPIMSIPIFNQPNLLNQLKNLLWTTKSEKISNPTGIPPHVVTMVTLEKIVTMFKEEKDARRKMYENIESTVGQKLEEIANKQGHITRPMVEKLFKNLSDEIQNKIDDKIDSALASIPTNNPKL